MKFEEKDFPLYGLLVANGEEGASRLIADFNAAAAGEVEKQYGLALGLHGICTMPGIETQIPGMTQDIIDGTLRKSLEVFEYLANNNHGPATVMSALCNFYGLGCAQDNKKGHVWLEKAKQFPDMLPTLQQMLGDQMRESDQGNKKGGRKNEPPFSKNW